MTVLMKSMEIDKIAKKRVDMSSLVASIEKADEDGNVKIIDMTTPEYCKHYFAGGSYVREMLAPKDMIIVGRIHKKETVNILLEGEILVFDESGGKKLLKAPAVFVAPAGNQKAAVTITDVRWLNSFACETTDPDEALNMMTCKTIEEYEEYIRLEGKLCLEC